MSSEKRRHTCWTQAFTCLGLMVSLFLLAIFCPVRSLTAQGSKSEGGILMTLELTSPAFSHNDPIPAIYTCDGRDISPPLIWNSLPTGTRSLALIVEDPDAPDPKAPRMTWIHWVLYNIPAETAGLTENTAAGNLPADTLEGLNNWGKTGYGGPCPPVGRHRYFFKLYALDTELPDLNQPNKEKLLQAMQNHILDQAELIGTYQR